jgi:signal transduction histidine kinase
VQADGDLLRRVLENLVDNAIRHAPEATQVEVAADRADGGVAISVSDDGPGIPAELRERVFDRFVQVGSERLISRAGRGLGLAFCKLAVEAHGGSICVLERSPGTSFRILLPR